MSQDKRILVVDDAATVRMYHRKVLRDAGWTVDEAMNGLEALEKALAAETEAPYDLYVVDVNMPKMDGYTFIRELRRQAGERAQAPVMMVSTEARTHDASRAFTSGANCYLVKPAGPAALVMTAALLLGDASAATTAARGVTA